MTKTKTGGSCWYLECEQFALNIKSLNIVLARYISVSQISLHPLKGIVLHSGKYAEMRKCVTLSCPHAKYEERVSKS